jgi:hypothetical protein
MSGPICGPSVDHEPFTHNTRRSIPQVGDHGGSSVDSHYTSHQQEWVIIHNPQPLLIQLPDQITIEPKVTSL